VPFFLGKKPSCIAVAAFVEVMEHERAPHVPNQNCRAHFRTLARSIAGIDCDSKDVMECRDGMEVVHKSVWHQMNDGVMNERACAASPVVTNKPVSVVTP